MAKFEMNGVDRIIDELGRMDALTGPMAEGGTLKAAILNTLHLGSNGGGRGLVQPVPAGGLWSYLLLAMALAWWGMRRVANKRA